MLLCIFNLAGERLRSTQRRLTRELTALPLPPTVIFTRGEELYSDSKLWFNMPSRQEVAYFGAGPAPLPTSVIEAGGQAFVNFKNTGIGLAELSHRSPTANGILAETKEALTKLYDIPDTHEIIFMQAGGTGEFSAVVHNLVGVWIEKRRQRALRELNDAAKSGGESDTDSLETWTVERLKKEIDAELKMDYLVTGSWSKKASQEASRLLGDKYVNVATNAQKANGGKFGIIPEESDWKLTPTKKQGGPGPAFVYLCDNETVDGVEFSSFPKCLEPEGVEEEDERIVVADMSSNFLSRKVDVSKYGVIFVSSSPWPSNHECQQTYIHSREVLRRTWVSPA